MRYLLFALTLTASIASCDRTAPKQEYDPYSLDPNPAAPEFNIAESDSLAIALADEVMAAMGGRKAWDSTRYLAWNFFGRRDLLWDKFEHKVRIESPGDSMIYLIDLKNISGHVYKAGIEVTDSLNESLVKRGHSIWINDSYWLVMPYKLKDSGVTLTYRGSDTTQYGIMADVLQLTFEGVGDTPDNKYHVWVDKKDQLVKQWAYFRDAAQDTANAIWPFDNYKKSGNILLSSDRSDDRGPKNARVLETVPERVFEDPSVTY